MFLLVESSQQPPTTRRNIAPSGSPREHNPRIPSHDRFRPVEKVLNVHRRQAFMSDMIWKEFHRFIAVFRELFRALNDSDRIMSTRTGYSVTP